MMKINVNFLGAATLFIQGCDVRNTEEHDGWALFLDYLDIHYRSRHASYFRPHNICNLKLS